MNASMKYPIQPAVRLAILGMMLARRVAAQQPLTILDQLWDDPEAGLIISGNTLYGTTRSGGDFTSGSVFAINTDGTGFTNIHSFGSEILYLHFTNNDGGFPLASLVLSSNTLYGTTSIGGTSGTGTVFKVNTDGSDFTVLHAFAAGGPIEIDFHLPSNYYTNEDGAFPHGGLVLSGNTLYGTTCSGGPTGVGTVFQINTDGSGFNTLHAFNPSSDGAFPAAALALSSNTLYGTAYGGGSAGSPTVYALQTDGSGFTNLHSFQTHNNSSINFDGFALLGSLVVSNNVLYGTASQGGPGGWGTIFSLNPDGTGFNVLHQFGMVVPFDDGSQPRAGLLLVGDTLYGTTAFFGPAGAGAVFSVKTDGTDFTVLNGFNAPPVFGIGTPLASLINSGWNLYGTASGTGEHEVSGAVFSISMKPQLSMIVSGTNVTLSWPTNTAGFDYSTFTLQCTTNNPGSPVGWSPVLTMPVATNGQYKVTTSVTGTQVFYRLAQ